MSQPLLETSRKWLSALEGIEFKLNKRRRARADNMKYGFSFFKDNMDGGEVSYELGGVLPQRKEI